MNDTKKWVLDVGIAIDDEPIDQVLEMGQHLESTIGMNSDSSGCGFGFRDMQFHFESTEDEAETYKKAVVQILKDNGLAVADGVDGASGISYVVLSEELVVT